MSKVIYYHLLRSRFIVRLSLEVNDAIEEGWQPLGGVAVDGEDWYTQAMVKCEEEE